MAFISPAADKNPDMAKAVNVDAVGHIVQAIEEQPGGCERVKLVSVGSVAQTGDRLPPIHVGRVGDPLKPSIFDFYACTKIAGERIVLESKIKHWASIRQTFIMIPDIMSLQDPIMFHQPLWSCMENNTARDAGRGLINCLDIPPDSDFWRRVYNMGGGPRCRTTYEQMLERSFAMLGLDYKNVFERRWFATRNFHMQFFEDSSVLNEYLHNWNDSMEDHYRAVWKSTPLALKAIAKACKVFPPIKRFVERASYKRMKELASKIDGSLGWYLRENEVRLTAFYKDKNAFESIPDWNKEEKDGNNLDKGVLESFHRLDHGYDETKHLLDLGDLKRAAAFRGGKCASAEWNGDLYVQVSWACARGHGFEARPYTVLKAGHWCPECVPPPWDYDQEAKINPFFAQVWYPNHDKTENNQYSADCYLDIVEGK